MDTDEHITSLVKLIMINYYENITLINLFCLITKVTFNS